MSARERKSREAQERSFGFRIPFGRPVEWASAFVRERPDAHRERLTERERARERTMETVKERHGEATERQRGPSRKRARRRRKGPPAPHNAA